MQEQRDAAKSVKGRRVTEGRWARLVEKGSGVTKGRWASLPEKGRVWQKKGGEVWPKRVGRDKRKVGSLAEKGRA